jgi:hypothetical protein
VLNVRGSLFRMLSCSGKIFVENICICLVHSISILLSVAVVLRSIGLRE